MTSSTCRLWASSSTEAMIFSIRTAISQPSRFCSSVARLRHAGGELVLHLYSRLRWIAGAVG